MTEEGSLSGVSVDVREHSSSYAAQEQPQLLSVRARTYGSRARAHQTSRVMRRMMFRADADLSVAAGIVQLEAAEDRLLRLLD